jgi:3-hydroxyacyl-[acyl-carrier-protein] dehydratase
MTDAEAMAEILAFLPHRPPFLFADRVEIEGERILGYRLFKPEEDFFKGHFPSYPVVPGVILLESMFQCGGVGVRKMGIVGMGTFFLAKVKEARFRRQVRPAETFRTEIENLRATPRIVHQRGAGYVGDEMAVEAEWISIAGGSE